MNKTYKLVNFGVLALILLLGFSLRSYHINFPSIGYHNMKENDLLSIAQEMDRTKDFITKRVYFLQGLEDEPMAKQFPQVSLIPYQILISWKLFRENLWGPRLLNIIFGVSSILVIYFIARLLFRNTILSLFCAFLFSIMPLAVFFSRNIQPESPGFFFMLLGNLFYLRYATSLKRYNLILGGVSFSIAWLYKFSFLIGLFPLVFCLPFKSFFRGKKEFFKSLLALVSPYLIIVVAIVWLKHTGQWNWEQHVLKRVVFWKIFISDYWEKYGRTLWWYMKGENFTFIYIFLALLGILVTFFKRKDLLNRYITSWTLTIIPYCMIFSDFINQHNYYQMPFLPLICISSTYAVFFISETVSIKNIPKKYLPLFLMIIVVGVSAPFVYNSITRMYATVFYGMDTAGESLKEFTKPQERIFLLTHHQGQGIARYARRYVGWTENLDEFKEKEKKFSIRYICFYPAEFALALKANNSSLFDYIQNNYHVKEVGLTEEPSQLYYLILEKGKGSDPQNFLQSFSGQRQLRTIYRMFGRYIFVYTLRPPVE